MPPKSGLLKRLRKKLRLPNREYETDDVDSGYNWEKNEITTFGPTSCEIEQVKSLACAMAVESKRTAAGPRQNVVTFCEPKDSAS